MGSGNLDTLQRYVGGFIAFNHENVGFNFYLTTIFGYHGENEINRWHEGSCQIFPRLWILFASCFFFRWAPL